MNKEYITHFDNYLDRLCKEIKPYLFTNGGPVIMVQCENEYGYYGDDTRYMEAMRDIMLERGVEVPLITSDGPFPESLSCGNLEGAHVTGNFGSRTKEIVCACTSFKTRKK